MQSYEFYYYIFKHIDNVYDLINVSKASPIFDKILKDIKKEKVIKFKKMKGCEGIRYYMDNLQMYIYYPKYAMQVLSREIMNNISEDLIDFESEKDRDLFFKDHHNLPYSFFKNRKRANKYRKFLKKEYEQYLVEEEYENRIAVLRQLMDIDKYKYKYS